MRLPSAGSGTEPTFCAVNKLLGLDDVLLAPPRPPIVEPLTSLEGVGGCASVGVGGAPVDLSTCGAAASAD